ncbi:MAG: DUF6232 family protein [Rhizonema sp. PD37]|nr:DUF6232 family protein [Rhizonema sp. PD37]
MQENNRLKLVQNIKESKAVAVLDLLGSSEDKRTFETADYIQITRNSIKFGSSVYQFRNVTGFRVGEIPKYKFPLQAVLILTIGGFFTLAFFVGWFLLLFAAFLVIRYFMQTQYYGLSLFLNSGQEKFFVSSDRNFLIKIVSVLYEFMENQREGSVYIDMTNKSVTVGGNLHGNATTGDDNTIY